MDLEKKRKRIARTAGINGWSMIVMAVLCLASSLLSLSASGILVGLILLASGCMEVKGRRLVKRSSPGARSWLAGSQLVILVPVALYCGYHILLFSPKEVILQMKQAALDMRPYLGAQSDQIMDDPQVQSWTITAFRYFYPSLLACTMLYQGGLWLYYTLGARALDRAAAGTPKAQS